MRCAIVELNHYHDEVIPTFVWALNRLGVTPDVWLVARSAKRRPFGRTTGLRYRRRAVERMDWLGGLPFRLGRYDVVIVNSLEPPEVLDRVGAWDVPILGVVHNPATFLAEPAYRAFLAQPRRRLLVLGEHVAASLAATHGRVEWLTHVVFGPGRTDTPGGPTTFAVTGNVEFERRNYRAFLEAVTEIAGEGLPFRVRIIGRSFTPDGKALRQELAARGLADRFTFSPGEIDHPRFLDLVATSDFSVPLLDTSTTRIRLYLRSKIAAGIPIAIGLGVPLVSHEALAEAYGLAGTGPQYVDGGLAAAMRAAIESDEATRAAWRSALDAKREAILDTSLANLRQAIAAITGPASSPRPSSERTTA